MSDLTSRKWYEAQLEERARLSQTLAEIGGVLTREQSVEAMLEGCLSRPLESAPGSRPHLGSLIPETRHSVLRASAGTDRNLRSSVEAEVWLTSGLDLARSMW